MKIKNKRGSIAVFLMIFFASMVTAIGVFIHQSEQLAISGMTESAGNLFCQSVLAEYDCNLKDRYEIFGFYGYECDVNKKCNFYADEIFGNKKHVELEGIYSDLGDFSLGNINVFKKQVIEVGKLASIGKLFKEKNKEEVNKETEKEGIIRNNSIKYYLPSNGSQGNISLIGLVNSLKQIGNIKELVKKSSDRYFINSYINNFFKSAGHEDGIGETLFKYEKEYIICGKFEDNNNLKGVRNRIIGIREPLNYVFLKKDKIKYGEAYAAAQILTPGPAAAATCETILGTWALAESINDYKLLMNNHNVPVVKTKASWAVDLESVLNNKEEKCIFTGKDEGESYDDYLNLLLYGLSEDIVLLRIMDLIQINMKLLYYDNFMLREYNSGVKLSIKINGELYDFKKEY